MSDPPEISHEMESETYQHSADGAGGPKCLGSDLLEETRLSEKLNRCQLDGSMPTHNAASNFAQAGSKGDEPRTIAHDGSRAESNISNSQITAGRDNIITPYNGTAVESNKEASGSKSHVDTEDDVAAGMMIPAPPPCVFERDSQHDQIVAKLLSVPNARVAILGMGGIGKTSLACNIGSDPQVVEAYRHRLFLSFEGCTTPDLAYTNLATAFHIPIDRRSSHRQILSQVLNYLKREKILFIIDNFETLWEMSSNRRAAEDFLAQLAAQPELAIVVTLRGIQRPGNIRWLKMDPLQTLTQHASMDLLSAITDEEYPESDLVFIRKLLNAVAGIPLAVTLIGSLLRDGSETPRSLWNHWSRESARAIRVVNEADSDDRLYRLDISLRLSVFSPRMSDNVRALLAAISVLPNGMNMDEEWQDRFQKLLPDTIRIRDCIRTLRNVALATLDSSTSPPRLRLLPPVRDFCLNNLSLDGEIPRRLADIYHKDVPDRWDWASNEHYTWVTTELSNIRAILDLIITLGYITDDFGSFITHSTGWQRFLCIRDTDVIERVLRMDVLSEHSIARGQCLLALGTALVELHREKEAIPWLEQALSIHKQTGSRYGEGRALYLIGDTKYRLRDHASAEQCLRGAKDLYAEDKNDWMNGLVWQVIAANDRVQKKLPEAECASKEALKLCRASGNRAGEAMALLELGRAYGDQGKCELAFETLNAAVNASKVVHDIQGEACAHASLGIFYDEAEMPDQATSHLRLALPLFERAQDSVGADIVRSRLQKIQDL